MVFLFIVILASEFFMWQMTSPYNKNISINVDRSKTTQKEKIEVSFQIDIYKKCLIWFTSIFFEDLFLWDI